MASICGRVASIGVCGSLPGNLIGKGSNELELYKLSVRSYYRHIRCNLKGGRIWNRMMSYLPNLKNTMFLIEFS